MNGFSVGVRGALLTIAVSGPLLLGGCAEPAPSATDLPVVVTPSSAPTGAVPAFTGPFAAELRDAWLKSNSDFVRGVVEDQVISDQEWAELSTRMSTCFSRFGIEFRGFGDDGTYSTGPTPYEGDQLEKVLSGCENESGEIWIHGLKLAMSNNPRNEPVEEVMTACLIRNGAVDTSYTEEAFLRDNPSLSFPFMGTEREEIFWKCNSNPSYTE